MRSGFSRCRGFSLVSAIFLVVVLASLGAYMATMNSIQHTTTALSLQASRAWFAARSGMEWAIFFVRTNDACPTIPTSFSVAGFAVEVTGCTAYPAVEPEVRRAGAEWMDIPVHKAHVDGNLVSAPAWPAHPEWLSAFLNVLGTKIEP